MLLNWQYVGVGACRDQRWGPLHWHWQPSSGWRATTRAAQAVVRELGTAVALQLLFSRWEGERGVTLDLSGQNEGGQVGLQAVVSSRAGVGVALGSWLKCGAIDVSWTWYEAGAWESVAGKSPSSSCKMDGCSPANKQC